MIIHVVQPGETIYSLSEIYEISTIRLIQDNGLTNPNELVVGQTIVIVYPKEIYTVQEGDNLQTIADVNGVKLLQLMRNNPYLSNREFIYPGETIVISYQDEKIMKISTNGYAFPFLDTDILRMTLPFLTYLTIFTYRVTPEGEIIGIEDSKIIQIAKEYGVAPIMLLSTITNQGTFSSEVTHNILTNPEKQDQLIDNILTILQEKGYLGLNIDSQYILLEDKQLFVDFTTKITTRLNNEGYIVFVTLSPRTFGGEIEYLQESLDYVGLGKAANNIFLQSYEWGYSFGPPTAVMPYNIVRELLDFAVTQISSEKIFLGIPIIGYDWQLPYIPGVSRASSLSNTAAIELAVAFDSTIYYDEAAQAPYFYYTETTLEGSFQHIVWFKDARSITALTGLVPYYGFQGIGIWNIMSFFARMWLIINTQFEIEKIDTIV